MADSRRVKITKHLIRDALIELMEEKPIGKISIKEICEVADVNRSTFYMHYTDQYDLLKEIENEVVSQTPSINLYKNDPIYEVLKEFFVYVEQNKKLYRVLFQNTVGTRFRGKILNKVFGREEDSEGWIRKMDLSDELHFLMIMSAFGCMSVVERWVSDEIKSTPDELAAAVERFSSRKNK